MAKHNDNLFKKEFEKGFRKQYNNGLLSGAYAVCQVVLEKAKDDSMSADERLAEIIRFCEVSFPKKDATPAT